MSVSTQRSAARRSLVGLVAIIVGLIALLAGAHLWGTAQLAPKLGLDLQGGTQIILKPIVTGGGTVTTDALNKARDIIVQRVDANGVSGAEVTTQGQENIVVSIPGTPDQAIQDAISKSSQMQFRPVLKAGQGWPVPTASASATGSASPSPSGSASGAPGVSGSAPPSASASASASAAASPSASASASASPSASASSKPTGKAPTDPTSLDWLAYDPGLVTAFDALDCSQGGALSDLVDDPKAPLVTCDAEGDGAEKYILGPVVVSGESIKDAQAGYQSNQQGQITNTVEIALTLGGDGVKQYADISRKMIGLPSPQNRLAATLDSRVIVAPYFQAEIPDGRASITGNFTLASAQALAQSLKFGALPMSFEPQQSADISPTLGADQLRYGLLAGLVGLLLVLLYSFLQYRVLSVVTISSIVIAALLTYLTVTVLGWAQNFRLDMAGVTGLIVAIGFTADSFIVYFERIKDELREGRSLASAIETGWARAKRTILAADGVNFLAALVLYLLASANVRGFAFTLGLTTLIDLLVVFLFTHPVVALLARLPFFRDGHRWSGLDPTRLGAKVRYAGRGRFTSPASATASTGSTS